MRIKGRYIEAAEILTHSHGAEGEHAHNAICNRVILAIAAINIRIDNL